MADLSGKLIKLILENSFHYTGRIIHDTETHLIILDKNNSEVTIKKSSIMLQEVLE